MSASKLRQVLTIMENMESPLSLSQIAQSMDVSEARLESMIQYWINKGKIRESATCTVSNTCGCGDQGSCSCVTEQPRGFELVE